MLGIIAVIVEHLINVFLDHCIGLHRSIHKPQKVLMRYGYIFFHNASAREELTRSIIELFHNGELVLIKRDIRTEQSSQIVNAPCIPGCTGSSDGRNRRGSAAKLWE